MPRRYCLKRQRITMWYHEYYQQSPRQVKGGIKAQSARGSFGKNWWAKRWISALESFTNAARLTRGRSYARKGQVVAIDIDKGKIQAKVQGTQVRPYRVEISVTVLSPEEWQTIVCELSNQALYVAKLMAGEMPQDIEKVFTEVKLDLFPKKRELHTDCSCPDIANPCKHIAAVYYLLGEEFDRDPFLIFKLRGMDREPLLELLGVSTPKQENTYEPQKLSIDSAFFWKGEALKEDIYGSVQPPPVPASLLKRLGSFPFWRGNVQLEQLVDVYQKASQTGIQTFIARTSG